MADELQDAILHVRAQISQTTLTPTWMSIPTSDNGLQVSGDKHCCRNCASSMQGIHPRMGLVSKEIMSDPRSRLKVTSGLDELLRNTDSCWVCAWILNIVRTRYQHPIEAIPPQDHKSIKVGLEPYEIRTFETGKLSSDAFNDTLTLALLTVYVDLSLLDQGFHYLICFQLAEEHPPPIDQLLTQTKSLDWPRHERFQARIRHPQIDGRLILRWKEGCVSNHGDTCTRAEAKPVNAIRLIDVDNRCITSAQDGITWVALSYCWGGPQKHCLRKCNLAQYSLPGALTDSLLPTVIADALQVTQALGERYLWVDSLCIVQDDEVDIARYLTSMDAIYARSTVTIVNAANGNVNHPSGLPGVRAQSGRRIQRPFQINGVWMTESFDPGPNSFPGYLENSTWNTRGWTFQEALLSRRLLIFTRDQIYWQCQERTWCESSFWEEREGELAVYRHSMGSNILGSFSGGFLATDWITVYRTILEKYFARILTTEDDRLHALTGILHSLSHASGQEFHFGLPKSNLEKFLSFSTAPAASSCKSYPTIKHTYLNTHDQLVSCPFPSWSWLGWSGPKGTATYYPSIFHGVLGLRFHYIDDDDNPQLLNPTGTSEDTVTYNDTRDMIRYPTEARHSWMDATKQSITTEDIPKSVTARLDLRPSLLCFFTSTATLSVVETVYSAYHNRMSIVMSEEDKPATPTSIGLSNIHTTTPVPIRGLLGGHKDPEVYKLPSKAKFIVIGTERQRPSHGCAIMLRLLLVELYTLTSAGSDDAGKDESETIEGVYRRKHLVTEVPESAWEKLASRVWEAVFLG